MNEIKLEPGTAGLPRGACSAMASISGNAPSLGASRRRSKCMSVTPSPSSMTWAPASGSVGIGLTSPSSAWPRSTDRRVPRAAPSYFCPAGRGPQDARWRCAVALPAGDDG